MSWLVVVGMVFAFLLVFDVIATKAEYGEWPAL